MPKVPNISDFLQRIQQIESSGGTNLNHPVVTREGIQEGQKAIGRYGLLPNTVKELINRRRAEGTMTQPIQELGQLPDEEIRARLEASPELEDQLAHQLANIVTRKQIGDEDRAAYSWNMGHNLSPDDITNEKLQTSPYVQKYRKLKGLME